MDFAYVYIDGPTVTDAHREATARYDRVRWRNGRHFEKPDRLAGLVVTDIDRVREAYEKAGVPVEPLSTEEATDEDPYRDERYVVDPGGRGWYRILDRETGEHVDGASTRDEDEAHATAKRMNADG